MAAANQFKNAALVSVGTSFVAAYSAPPLMTSMLSQVAVCNLQNSGITVDVQIFRAGASQYVNLLLGVPVPAGATLKVIEDDRLILGPGDQLLIRTSVAAGADIFCSLVEDVNN